MTGISNFLYYKLKNPFPYLKQTYLYFRGKPQKTSQKLYAAAALGEQLSAGGTCYLIFKEKCTQMLLTAGSIGMLGLFISLSYKVYEIRALEEATKNLIKTNKKLEETAHLIEEDHKETTDKLHSQINDLKELSDAFGMQNKALKNETDELKLKIDKLEDVIVVSKITAESIEKLQKKNEECLSEYEKTAKKLDIVRELFEEERKKLANEVGKLTKQVDRLVEV